jgi:tRNA threonylcarbamoyladenosine biosynthesis protein TsaE
MTKTFSVRSVEDWDNVAQEILALLKPGTILALSGPLGVGKTTFVQALARALGVTKNPRSPTFSLLRTYEMPKGNAIKRLVHVDAYRLDKPTDILPLNLDEELAEPGTIIAMEWPEQATEWLAHYKERTIWMEMGMEEDGEREVKIRT